MDFMVLSALAVAAGIGAMIVAVIIRFSNLRETAQSFRAINREHVSTIIIHVDGQDFRLDMNDERTEAKIGEIRAAMDRAKTKLLDAA